jgi:two-component system, OmpR family, phosphate regulon sensor histidine kinase PhoR
LNSIIVLMAGVLSGLLVVQIIWIKRGIELKEQQFTENVHVALNEVALMLERQEAYDMFQQGLLNENDFPNSSIFNSSTGEDELKLITDIQSDSGSGYKITFNYDTAIIKGADGSRHLSKRVSISVCDTLIDVSEKMTNKQRMMNDLFMQFFSDRKNISERVDKQELSRLIKNTLAQHGIKTPFEFIVKDFYGRTSIDSEHSGAVKKGTVYKIALFPNDIFNDPNFLYVFFPKQKQYIFRSVGGLTFASIIFVIIIIVCFVYVVNVIFTQKKLNDMKNDFINNMTHELKTPVSTISLASEMLQKEDILLNKERAHRYAGIIYDENKRLGDQVEKVLQMAVLDKGDFKLKKTLVNVHEVIYKLMEKLSLQIENTNGKIQANLKANTYESMLDEIHFTNIISNLLDNAIKYSYDNPDITITTRNDNDKIYIAISDKGIGMSKDVQKRVFEKFYRVPTGNIHNVKGFGLGLSYVKIMVEAHNGEITLQSEPGKGSTFEIILPVHKIETT